MKLFSSIDDPASYCRDNLKVRSAQDEFIITISLESHYPAEAARLVDAVVDAYVAYHARLARNSAADVVQILNREKQVCQAELQEKSEAMAAFKQANGTLSLESDSGNIVLQRLARLSAALTDAQVQTMTAKASVQTVETLAGNPTALRRLLGDERSPAAMSSLESEIGALRKDLDALEIRLGIANGRYSPRHPAVQSLRDAVQEIKGKVEQKEKLLGEAWLASTRATLQEAQARQQEIQEEFDQQRSAAMALNEAAARYATFQADLQRAQKLYDALESRIQQLDVGQHAGGLNVTVLERAEPAGRPVRFRAVRDLGWALLAGACLGTMLALLREMLDKRFRGSREVVEELKTPVMAVVPWLSPGARLGGIQSDSDVPQKLVDACRTLRAALRFGGPRAAVHKLLITSPRSRDGRSSVALGLAVASAHAGRRTLLIEADFRRPCMQGRFGWDSPGGLSTVLTGAEPVQQATHHAPIDNLEVLGAGPELPAGSSLLEGNAFASMLEQLEREYDQIIIDAPHVTEIPETSVLAGLCDGVVIVLRAGRSLRTDARRGVVLLCRAECAAQRGPSRYSHQLAGSPEALDCGMIRARTDSRRGGR